MSKLYTVTLISGGKETNKDSPSNGERSGNSSSLKSPAFCAGELWPGEAAVPGLVLSKLTWKGLQASTILGQRPSQGTFCTLCRGVDHPRAQCALNCLQPPNTPASSPSQDVVSRTGRRSTNICISWNKGECYFPGQCVYQHVCATCQRAHKARDCPRTPDRSIYKSRQAPRNPPVTSARTS